MNERGGNGGGSGEVDDVSYTAYFVNTAANIVVNANSKKSIETMKLPLTKFNERLYNFREEAIA